MQVGLNAAVECIKAFSETDFTEDPKQIRIPTLVLHGDDDQVVPFAASAPLSAKLLANAVLKVYAGAPHALTATDRDRFNADLVEFVES
jgi:non-heme chloroperoxidase